MRLELKQEAVAFSKLNLKLRFCCLDVLTYLLLLNKKLFDNQLVSKEQYLAWFDSYLWKCTYDYISNIIC